MVDSDPDTNLFYDYDHDGTVVGYFVVYRCHVFNDSAFKIF